MPQPLVELKSKFQVGDVVSIDRTKYFEWRGFLTQSDHPGSLFGVVTARILINNTFKYDVRIMTQAVPDDLPDYEFEEGWLKRLV